MDKLQRNKSAHVTGVSAIDWSIDRMTSLSASNRYMLDTEDGCDVTLVVKATNDKTETRIMAHRYVLCSRCPEFYRLLWTAKGASEKKLKITDTSAEAMQQIIRYLYCEEADLTVTNVLQVMQAAQHYRVHPLTSHCLQFIESVLSASNVCCLLEQCSLDHHQQDETPAAVINTCLQYIAQNSQSVLASESFQRASVDVVRRIAGLDTLSVSEVELFESCLSWAKARCPPSLAGATTVSDQLRYHLSPVLDLIRFPTMSPEDFARRIVPLNILTDTEACNVYKYFTCPEKPPKRFITVKRKRPVSSPRCDTTLYPDPAINVMLKTASAPTCNHLEPPPKYEL